MWLPWVDDFFRFFAGLSELRTGVSKDDGEGSSTELSPRLGQAIGLTAVNKFIYEIKQVKERLFLLWRPFHIPFSHKQQNLTVTMVFSYNFLTTAIPTR